MKVRSCTWKHVRWKHVSAATVCSVTSPDRHLQRGRFSLLFALGGLAGLLLGVNVSVVLIFSLLVTFQFLYEKE